MAEFLRLRLAAAEHMADIWDLVQRYQETFTDDYHTPDPNWLAAAGLIVVLSGHQLVGVVAVSEIAENNLHGQLHFLMAPQYLRQAVREQLFWQIIHAVFLNYDLHKIKVSLMSTQTVGIKILKQLGFRRAGTFQNETRKSNVPVNVVWYEMTRQAWQF